MEITFIAFVIYAVGTLVFMWFVLRRLAGLKEGWYFSQERIDKLEHLVQGLDIYTQCFHQDLEEMEDRFELMCKDVIELKTKPVKKGKK